MKFFFVRFAIALGLSIALVGCSEPTLAPEASVTATITASTPASTPSPAKAVGTVVKGPSCKYLVSRGPNCSSYVVLSFDDCALSYKDLKSMELGAEKLNVALVFFPTGDCIKIKRFKVAYALKHGHYVFNHSVTHPQLTTLRYKATFRERYKAVLRELGSPGVQTNYGRPPYGAYNTIVRKAYAAKHMRIWNWGVDTLDWKGKSRASIVRYVVKNAHAGQTVLMHMRWNGFSVTALRQIIAGLAKRGLKVCRNYPGTTPAVLSGNLRC